MAWSSDARYLSQNVGRQLSLSSRVLIALIILLAGILRGIWLDRRCLFFDEIWHMELSTGRGSAHLRLPLDQLLPPQPNPVMLEAAPPWYSIWTHMDWVIHPPFYHFTLRAWRAVSAKAESSRGHGRSLLRCLRYSYFSTWQEDNSTRLPRCGPAPSWQ